MKRWLIMCGAVLALVALIGGIKAYSIKQQMDGYAAAGEPTSTVSTTLAAYADWQPSLSAVGSLRAVRGVDLAAEVAGLVQAVKFSSGSEASAGELLVQLGNDSDQARLQSLKADAALARVSVERAVKQLEAQAISKSQLDIDQARLKSADAVVAEQQAVVNKKAIRAPFAGRLGISLVNPGQYLNAGDKIVTLQQLDPIYLDFSLPQGVLSQIKPGQTIAAETDAYPGVVFKGEISAVNPVVDTNTRNLRIQATLGNPERKLLPGMFANVKVSSGTAQRLLTLPQNAVTFNPYGETVFLVVPRGAENAPDPNKPAGMIQAEALKQADASRKAASEPASPPAAAKPASNALVARQVFVTAGPTRGDQVAILSGLKEGDEVVTSGQLKLKNGTLVVVNNTVQPSNAADPRPVDH